MPATAKISPYVKMFKRPIDADHDAAIGKDKNRDRFRLFGSDIF